MVEAWGAIGDALTDASIGYLEAINKAPDVRLARRKAELELLKLEEDTALSRARAAAAGKLKDRVISNKYGVWKYDEDTDQLKTLYEAPPKEESDPDKVVKWGVLRGLEQKLGKPQKDFTWQDYINPDPEVQALWDRYRGRSDITTVPGVGPYRTSDVRGGANQPTAPPARDPGQALGKGDAGNLGQRMNNPYNIKVGGRTQHWIDSGQAEVGDPAQDGGRFIKFKDAQVGEQAGRELLTGPFYRNLTVDEAMRRWSGNGYGAEVAPGLKGDTRIADLSATDLDALMAAMRQKEGWTASGKDGGVAQPTAAPKIGPDLVARQKVVYERLSDQQMKDEKWQLDRLPASPVRDAKLEAWQAVMAARSQKPTTPPVSTGTAEGGTTATDAQPAARTTPPPSAAVPAAQPAGGPRVVQPLITSPAQVEKQARDRRDQELQEIAALESNARLDLAKKEAERHRLGGGPTNKQNSVANDLYSQRLIDNPNYADLTNPAHRKLVDDVIEAPELEKRHREAAKALHEARAAQIAEERNARQERLALTGPVTTEQAAITARLFSEKQVKKEHYSELEADEKTLVNKIKDAPLLRKEHQEALKLAQPMMDELAMLESTQYLTRQILPLLTKANVGLGGTIQNFSNWAWTIDPGYRAAHIAKAEAQLEKEGMGPKIDEALSAARAAAIVEGTDPGIMNSLHYTGGRSRLEALSALLIYAHAMAQKRIGAGTARGITTEDMKEARELFDPANWFATPDKMVERIVALQGFIQRSRLRKEEEVRQRHIDPATGYLVLKDYTIDQLSGKAPVVPQTPSSAADRLKQGPKKKTE